MADQCLIAAVCSDTHSIGLNSELLLTATILVLVDTLAALFTML